MMSLLYCDYPREFMIQNKFNEEKRRIVCKDKEEFLQKIKEYIQYTDIYSSVYAFAISYSDNTVDYKSAMLDKIYIDTDPQDYNSVDDMMTALIKFDMKNRKYKRLYIFSGRGFHIYVFIDAIDIVYKESYIENIQLELIENTGIIIDNSCVGRVDKLARIVGSRNMKSKLFCISLTNSELYLSYSEIQNIAQKQRKTLYLISGDNFPVRKDFDFEKNKYKNLDIKIDINNILSNKSTLIDKMKDYGIDVEKIPNCILNIINTDEIGFEERCILILYIKYCGLSIDECRDILKLILDPSRYYHVTGEIIGDVNRKYLGRVENQDRNIYKKDYYLSCKLIKKKGFCLNCEFSDILHNLIK